MLKVVGDNPLLREHHWHHHSLSHGHNKDESSQAFLDRLQSDAMLERLFAVAMDREGEKWRWPGGSHGQMDMISLFIS